MVKAMHPPSDEALETEVIAQLHDLDDRRDAAEMRVEELVRDTEYESPETPSAPRRRGGRVAVALFVAAAAALLWLIARLIPA